MIAGPALAALHEDFHYEPATGVFTRRRICDRRFSVGQQVGDLTSHGYLRFSVRGHRYSAHRLAWLYVNGEWPRLDIDHVNGVKTDNRIVNLRAVSRSVNLQNIRGPRRDNLSTGLLGAYVCGHRFTSRISVLGVDRYLGIFATAEAAHVAYIAAKRQLHEGFLL